MLIKSDTKNKFLKMLEGSVFDSPTTFITELLQNSQRSSSKNVHIFLENDILTIEDDGCGLKKPESILTFDYSEWKTTQGFGIGFWSILAIPNLESVEIFSNKHHIYMDIEKVKNDLEVETNTETENHKGFKVVLKSSYFINNFDCLKEKVEEEGRYMPYKIFFNNEDIVQCNLIDEIRGLNYHKYFNTRLFQANLEISRHSYYPTVYFEKRKVCQLFVLPHVTGVIELKPNAVNLKEPDRKAIVYNDKRYKLEDKLRECIVILYKEFLASADNDDINNFADAIEEYLELKDFEKYLFVDESISLSLKDTLKSSIDSNEVNVKEALDILNKESNEEWVLSDKTISDIDIDNSIFDENNLVIGKYEDSTEDTDINSIEKYNKVIINDKVFIRKDKSSNIHQEEEIVEPDEIPSDCLEVASDKTENNIDTSDFQAEVTPNELKSVTNLAVKKVEKNPGTFLKDILKKNKACMWVKSEEIDEYINFVSLAEYNGIKVLKAKNNLFVKYFESKGVPHVSEVNNLVISDDTINNMYCKTLKEEMFILLLEPIRKHFDLPKNIFKLGDITSKIYIDINGRKVKTQSIKNTPNNIEIFGLRYGEFIILDRKAMNLKKFNISIDKNNFSIGKNEFKCLMNNIDTIAHELAHYLYGTVDNTTNHYKAETALRKEITEIYLNY